MATQVDLGKIRPVWKGDWAASTAYEQNDMVKVGVDSYICTAAHTSGSTFADTNWDILALGAEMPDQTGNSGEFLTTNGTSMEWAALPPSDDASALTQGTLDVDRLPSGTIVGLGRRVVTGYHTLSINNSTFVYSTNHDLTYTKKRADTNIITELSYSGDWWDLGNSTMSWRCGVRAGAHSGSYGDYSYPNLGYNDHNHTGYESFKADLGNIGAAQTYYFRNWFTAETSGTLYINRSANGWSHNGFVTGGQLNFHVWEVVA
jgi:hypothetical protein